MSPIVGIDNLLKTTHFGNSTIKKRYFQYHDNKYCSFFVAGNRRSVLEGWIHVTVHPIILSFAAVIALSTLGDKWIFFHW